MSDCKYPEDNMSYFENDLNCYEEKPHNDDSCNHEDNCHHEDHHCDEIKCCTDCAPFKPNCKPECCSGLPKVVPDLNNVKAVPVLTNRIFDCIKLENPNFAISQQTFKIISTPPPNTNYNEGDKVCIDKICVKYNHIGALITNNGYLYPDGKVSICSKTVTPQAVPGSSTPSTFPSQFISNNFVFNTTNTSCCYENNRIKEGKQCKVIEQNIPFRILGLKIIVTGRVGCLPFTAEYVPSSTVTGLYETLGLPNNYNFFGKLCIPQSNSGVVIREVFEPCLSIDCIEPTTDLFNRAPSLEDNTDQEIAAEDVDTNKPGKPDNQLKFKANIESSLLIKKTIYALAEEKLSVLTIPTPRNQQCHKQDHDNPCNPCSYDRD